MAYDENFYRMYQEYLREPVVRANHSRMFAKLAQFLPGKLRVMDLGCGSGEYPTFDGHHYRYVGVDLINTGQLQDFIQADYIKENLTDKLPFKPNAFLSLFSIECCHPVDARYALYEKLFAEHPSLELGAASGFFYESKRHQPTVSETGDIVSYQTIEDPAQYISPTFDEARIHMRTPSKMFGPDVIEVWKFLFRK